MVLDAHNDASTVEDSVGSAEPSAAVRPARSSESTQARRGIFRKEEGVQCTPAEMREASTHTHTPAHAERHQITSRDCYFYNGHMRRTTSGKPYPSFLLQESCLRCNGVMLTFYSGDAQPAPPDPLRL